LEGRQRKVDQVLAPGEYSCSCGMKFESNKAEKPFPCPSCGELVGQDKTAMPNDIIRDALQGVVDDPEIRAKRPSVWTRCSQALALFQE
jgi:predicted RNA-binding Zn-ribbon protein involved in translation (DUF1610 family)